MTENSRRPEPLVLLYVPDMFYQSRVEDALRHLDARPCAVTKPEHMLDRLPDIPSLAIVDLSAPGWEHIVRQVRRNLRHVPIVAFAPHVETALREKAKHLGCEHVLTRGQFLRNPSKYIIPYLTRPTVVAGCEEVPNALVRQGIEEFNSGRYYECHETLETAWRAETRPVRDMYQAILQLGVALYHVQQGNRTGAQKVLLRALHKFHKLPDRCQGVDIATLHRFALRLLQALREGEDVPTPPPHIHI